MKITQTKNLITAKDSQVKRFDEEHMLLENKKSDKSKELSNMLHKSIEKVDAIRSKQNEDMAQFEEAETTRAFLAAAVLNDDSAHLLRESLRRMTYFVGTIYQHGRGTPRNAAQAIPPPPGPRYSTKPKRFLDGPSPGK